MDSRQDVSAADTGLKMHCTWEPQGLVLVIEFDSHRSELGPFSLNNLLRLAAKILRAKAAGVQHGPAAAVSFDELVEQLQDSVETAELNESLGMSLLHSAACLGQAAVTQLLLQVAPDDATDSVEGGRLALHYAAERGLTAALPFFLEAAPGTLTVTDEDALTPLHCALYGMRRRPECEGAARYLAAAMPAEEALRALAEVGAPAQPLFADCVAAHLPLGDSQWALVSTPCHGLGKSAVCCAGMLTSTGGPGGAPPAAC